MRYFILLTTFILFSCAKGNHTGKVWNTELDFGSSDPCENLQRCQFVEYLSFNDPLLEKKVHKYFPGYQLGQSTLYLYQVGQKYSLKKEGNYNQSYDFESGLYNPGCKISYDESRIIYKIIPNLIDEEGDKYTRIVYKYITENPILLTKTTECEEYLADSWQFEDEDFQSTEIYEQSAGLDQPQVKDTGINFDLSQAETKIDFFVVKVDGEFFIRRVVKVKEHTQTVEIFNEESGSREKVEVKVAINQITVSHPDQNNIGNKYEYLEILTDGVKTIQDATNLMQLQLVSVDPAEAPDEP